MRVSSKTEYAIRTLMDLSIHGNDGPVCIGDIAERQKIPVKFLEQILLMLKGAGLTRSRRGPKGGYNLARKSDEITLGDVVRLTEGIRVVAENGQDNSACPIHELWEIIETEISETLDSKTIEGLCMRARELAGTQSQHYSI